MDQVKLAELIAEYRRLTKYWQELLEKETTQREKIEHKFAKDQGAELRNQLRSWAEETGLRSEQTSTVEALKEAERKLFFYVLNNTDDPLTETEMRLIAEDYAERITYLKENFLKSEEEKEEEAAQARQKQSKAKSSKSSKASPAKKSPAKKPAAKKSENTKKSETAKKPATEKKAAAKAAAKPAAKKASSKSARKTAAKKPASKKSAAKKSAAKTSEEA